MFAVLDIITPCEGFFARRSQRAYLRKCAPLVIRTDDGLPFFILPVLKGKNGIDWPCVRQRLGKCALRVIAPRDTVLPDLQGLARYVPERLVPLMVLNTALRLLMAAGVPPLSLEITLTDRTALLTGEVCRLLPFAATVRVITRLPERYSNAVKRAMEEFGASLIVSDKVDYSCEHGFIICCDGAVPGAANARACLSFGKSVRCGCGIACTGVELDAEYASRLPSGIEPLDFAGALYELCGSASFAGADFTALNVNGRLCDYTAAAECLSGVLTA